MDTRPVFVGVDEFSSDLKLSSMRALVDNHPQSGELGAPQDQIIQSGVQVLRNCFS